MSTRNKVFVGISGTIGREIDKAIQLFYFDTQLQKEIPVWLPLSQISCIIRAPKGDAEAKSVLMVAEWIVEKNDMHFIPASPQNTSQNLPSKAPV